MAENAIHFGLSFHEMDDPCPPRCPLARKCRVKSVRDLLDTKGSALCLFVIGLQ